MSTNDCTTSTSKNKCCSCSTNQSTGDTSQTPPAARVQVNDIIGIIVVVIIIRLIIIRVFFRIYEIVIGHFVVKLGIVQVIIIVEIIFVNGYEDIGGGELIIIVVIEVFVTVVDAKIC